MKHCAVDKKVAGIIRWLERLKKSYSEGAVESALMDAECARADLENLRNDVWQTVKPDNHNENKFFYSVIRTLRCASLIMIVILFSVVPLAKDKVPSATSSARKSLYTNPNPIIVIYEDEQEEKPEVKVTKAEALPKKAARRQTAQKKPSVNQKTVTAHQTSAKTVPYDKVLSLVQTGQRALKENTSVISIKK